MEEKIIIYSLQCPIDGQIKYIGATKNLIQRMYQHRCGRENNNINLSNWLTSLKEKGLKPISNIEDIINKSDWNFYEQYYICLYKSWEFNLYNIAIGGKTGYINYHINKNKNIGRVLTEVTKDKIRQKALGREVSIKTREKLSKAFKGRDMSHLENYRKIYGHPQAKQIKQYSLDGEFIKTWNAIKDASTTLGINANGICGCCKGKYKTAGKFIWKYCDI